MNDRAQQLHATVDGQIAELIDLLSTADDAQLSRLIPGREKLGDGTARTIAAHTALNYLRIAGFASGSDGHSPHGMPSGVDALGTLRSARERLTRVAELTNEQLDAVPSKDSFRFCDGQRTLEQVLSGLFKHQEHAVVALTTGLRESASRS
jgi:hypothetical protein